MPLHGSTFSSPLACPPPPFEPRENRAGGARPEGQRAERAAPTEKRDGKGTVGEVHDPRAHLLGGVAGHAGLFSTADDLAVYAQMILGGGAYKDKRVLNSETE